MAFIKRLLLFLLLVLSGAAAWKLACAWDETGLTKLGDDVYARIVSPDGEAVGNSGFVVWDDCVLVFDTHFTPEAGQALLASIRSVTSKPVCYVVNSHYHADHTHGNQVFEQAQIIGSTNARRDELELDLPSLNRTLGVARTQLRQLEREIANSSDSGRELSSRVQIRNLQQYLDNLSRLHIQAPAVTLDDRMIIKNGQREAEIRFLGEGHTDGDLVLILASAKIAFLGDLFFNDAIPNVQDARILKWMETLQKISKLEADTFVPGHGPVGDKKALERFLNYFRDLKASVEISVDRGDSVEQAIQEIKMPAKYSSYHFQNFFPANVQKMYAEIKALRIAAQAAKNPSKSRGKKAND